MSKLTKIRDLAGELIENARRDLKDAPINSVASGAAAGQLETAEKFLEVLDEPEDGDADAS